MVRADSNPGTNIVITARAEDDNTTVNLPDGTTTVVDWNNTDVGTSQFVVNGIVNTSTNSIVWEEEENSAINTCLLYGVC